MLDKPKILVVDIETAPAELWGWGMFKQNFGVNQVKADPYILCVGAQWLGDKDVMMFSKWEHGTLGMLQAISDLITEADMIIGKNSEKFDVPWLTTEFTKHGVELPPPTTHLDLEKTARKHFRFLSNKLEYIVEYLGVGKKMDTGGFELWRDVMDGVESARRKMLRYCARDVKITGKLYLKMRRAIPNHPHMGFTPKKQ